MTIKKLAVLGSVLAGAAFLQNKERRGRLMQSATDLIHNARERLTKVTENLTAKGEEEGAGSGYQAGTSRSGDTERSTPKFTESSGYGAGRNGIY